MLRTVTIAAFCLIGGIAGAVAQTSPVPSPQPTPPARMDTSQPDPDLAKFRAAYTSGDGISYVVINDAQGERIYRYGDAAWLTAKRDTTALHVRLAKWCCVPTQGRKPCAGTLWSCAD